MGSSVLERALAHFDSRPTLSVEVPEWGEGGNPETIYFRAPNASAISKAQKESAGDVIKMAAWLVALCAIDKDGKRIFTNMNWRDLFDRVDVGVLQRIAGAIMEAAAFSEASVQEAEKN